MAKQSMPERDRVGASLLATIACNSESLVSAREDSRRSLDKYITAKIRSERTVVILRVVDSPQLLKLLTPLKRKSERKGDGEIPGSHRRKGLRTDGRVK